MVGNGLCVIKQPWIVAHDDRLEPSEITVETWVKVPSALLPTTHGSRQLLAKNGGTDTVGHYGFTMSNKGGSRRI